MLQKINEKYGFMELKLLNRGYQYGRISFIQKQLENTLAIGDIRDPSKPLLNFAMSFLLRPFIY